MAALASVLGDSRREWSSTLSASQCGGEPRRWLGRSADRRALSPRTRQRLRADCLWRCRRLWDRRAYRLAGPGHDRLHPQPILEPTSRLPQPQFRYHGKRRAVWLQRPSEGADHCRHLPFLTFWSEALAREIMMALYRPAVTGAMAALALVFATSRALADEHTEFLGGQVCSGCHSEEFAAGGVRIMRWRCSPPPPRRCLAILPAPNSINLGSRPVSFAIATSLWFAPTARTADCTNIRSP